MERVMVICLVVFLSLPFRSFCNEYLEKEKTLGMIKPDGLLGDYTDLIKKIIQESGFSILGELMVQLDEDSVRSFHAEHSLKSFFPSLVKYMTSIRALCGMNSERNCVHVSDSSQSAAWEISFFFKEISVGGSVIKHEELLKMCP